MDLIQNEKESSVTNESSSPMKLCADCKTPKTPLWRSGPSGPKSLCNACGIRYRKKRGSSSNLGSDKKTEKGKLLRVRLVGLGKDLVLIQRQRSPMKRKFKLGEVEHAALLLMSLSCASASSSVL